MDLLKYYFSNVKKDSKFIVCMAYKLVLNCSEGCNSCKDIWSVHIGEILIRLYKFNFEILQVHRVAPTSNEFIKIYYLHIL